MHALPLFFEGLLGHMSHSSQESPAKLAQTIKGEGSVFSLPLFHLLPVAGKPAQQFKFQSLYFQASNREEEGPISQVSLPTPLFRSPPTAAAMSRRSGTYWPGRTSTGRRSYYTPQQLWVGLQNNSTPSRMSRSPIEHWS